MTDELTSGTKLPTGCSIHFVTLETLLGTQDFSEYIVSCEAAEENDNLDERMFTCVCVCVYARASACVQAYIRVCVFNVSVCPFCVCVCVREFVWLNVCVCLCVLFLTVETDFQMLR